MGGRRTGCVCVCCYPIAAFHSSHPPSPASVRKSRKSVRRAFALDDAPLSQRSRAHRLYNFCVNSRFSVCVCVFAYNTRLNSTHTRNTVRSPLERLLRVEKRARKSSTAAVTVASSPPPPFCSSSRLIQCKARAPAPHRLPCRRRRRR